jgi:guanylate kinase
MKKYDVIALIGEAGAGKDYLYRTLVDSYSEVNGLVSYTTRPPREGEVDGVNYHFVSREEFEKQIDEGKMLEYTEFRGWYYGTSKAALNAAAPNIGVFNVDGIYTMLEDEEIDLKIFRVIASDRIRLIRQLNRENNPDIEEIMRRYKTDKVDFEFLDFDYIELPNENWAEGHESLEGLCKYVDQILDKRG